jgi:DnaK suppressor protein
MLSQAIITQLKEKLEHMKITLESDLNDVAEKKDGKGTGAFNAVYPEGANSSQDDNAEEVSQYADGLSLVSELETQLRDVTKALESIANGTYGACKYCKQDIDLKRLEARPHSSSCVSCKKLLTQEL